LYSVVLAALCSSLPLFASLAKFTAMQQEFIGHDLYAPEPDSGQVERDGTVQSFANWLAEMKSKNHKSLNSMLSESSIIRDSITTNNMELTDFKRHSSSISQQMQSQLTDLREKLTGAFGEITSLVRQKTQSDSEMMQDVNMLQQSLSQKTSELEALKKSYSAVHQSLQSHLIQIQNHLQVTQSEVQGARVACDRVHRDTNEKFGAIEVNLKVVTDEMIAGVGESQHQMGQLKEEIARIQESLSSISTEFQDHKRSSNSNHNKLQSQVWGLEDNKVRQGVPNSPSGQRSYQPDLKASYSSLQSGGPSGSIQLPQHMTSPRRSPSLPQPMIGAMVPAGAPRGGQIGQMVQCSAGSLPTVQYMPLR